MNNNVVPFEPRARESARALESLPLLLSVPEAAKLLGISRSAAYRLADSGELPARRLGGRVYIVTAQLFAMVGAA